MAYQETFEIRTSGRGMSDVTGQVAAIVERAPKGAGLAHVFVRHTSCSLLMTENADPDVRRDLETLARRWAPDGDPAYRHDLEGDDDMAAHARSVLSGTDVTVPFNDGQLLLGTWQGIYLWEHRARGHMRQVVVTLIE
ncbi:secondary thiamine-phosphate synthase enzyme YjbQ [Aromatoleum aromaticum]|uniref:Secondary thiamine-phosphate synthase enzyme n=1 Tax=Aromatoleum aromaticum (strain DSM 19018 / LMG 30748 / EbN1) TaxID=76114 RepID=Q5P7Y8_AROAE|nr:secondary thiamine-phosphate synthase enzyme YjbQ [Aromatoleum aromaticum]NMG55467.1 YjbQ family protein [Aromatoleum aromaticum]CAI06573.1 conserved hypothetical protein [Aromatoleum aromaticum EbN1]